MVHGRCLVKDLIIAIEVRMLFNSEVLGKYCIYFDY